MPLGNSSATRNVIEKSIVLGGGTHWQITINQCPPSEMWRLFKASLDQIITDFHQISLLGCQGSLEISLEWTSSTMKEAFLIDIDG